MSTDPVKSSGVPSGLALAWRGALHHRRTSIAAAFGIAIATAVVVGAMIAGDSLRGTLRDRALARLGATELAVTPPRPLRAELVAAARTAAPDATVAPLLLADAVAEAANGGQTAPRVQLVGVDAGFWQIFPGHQGKIQTTVDPKTGHLRARTIAINSVLAQDLKLAVDDDVLLTIGKRGSAPAFSLLASRTKEKNGRTVRVTVAAILPDDRGPGAFSLTPSTTVTRTAFADAAWLGRAVEDPRTDAVLFAGVGAQAAANAIATNALPVDHGIILDQAQLRVSPSLRFVLSETQVAAVRQAATAAGGTAAVHGVYMAERITVVGKPEKSVSYSVIAGIDAPADLGGTPPPDRDGIVLSSWVAEDIAAKVGDQIALDLPVPTSDGAHRLVKLTLTVRGLAAATGLAADPSLLPDMPGLTDAKTLQRWDLPFPVDNSRFTPRDEEWWHDRRTTPKMFLHADRIREIWAESPGGGAIPWISGIRLIPPVGADAEFFQRFSLALTQALPPSDGGLVARPVRAEALTAASGGPDLAELFLSLGGILVLAAAGLAGVLGRLQTEARAAEAGVLLAIGWRPGAVRRLLLAEGAVIALLGALIGTGLGLAVAQALVSALNSGWNDAIGGVAISLQISGETLVIGGLSGFVIGFGASAWAVYAVPGRPVLTLLAGRRANRPPTSARSRWIQTAVVVVAALAAAGLVAAAVAGAISREAAMPSAGFLVIVAGLIGLRLLLTRRHSSSGTAPSWLGLALRSAGRDPARSLATAGLIAGAAFVLAAVAAARRDPAALDLAGPDSAAGGYALRVTTTLPLLNDPDSKDGRARLGFSADDETVLKDVRIESLLVADGDDASCRNQGKPGRPRVLAVATRLRERGGFGATKEAWDRLGADPGDGPAWTLADGDSALWVLKTGVGETLPFTAARNRSLKLGGTLTPGLFAGDLLMGETAFRKAFPGEEAPRALLVAVPSQQADAVAGVLRKRLAPWGAEVRSTRELIAGVLAVQNAYISAFLALGGLGLVLAAGGLGALLARALAERRGEIALLTAVGWTPGAVAGLIVTEYFVLIGSGLVIGLVAAGLSAAGGGRFEPLMPVSLLGGVLIVGLGGAAIAAVRSVRASSVADLRRE